MRDTAFRLNCIVISRLVGIGSAAAVAIAIGVDNVRLDRGYRRIIKAQPRDCFRAHGVDEDVSTGDHLPQRFFAVGAFDIEHDTALTAVHVDEYARHARHWPGRDVADIIAARCLHLDHIGAHVRHDLRRIGSENHTSQVNNANASQWAIMFELVGHCPSS